MTALLAHARALTDTARALALIAIADTAYAIAAWADTRDLDQELADLNYTINRQGHRP